MDEIKISELFRWNPESNEIIGSCWNHKNSVNDFIFRSESNLRQIQVELRNGNIHRATEALVFAVQDISEASKMSKIFLIIPICNHTNQEVIINTIDCTFAFFKNKKPKSYLNDVAIDADPNRRKAIFSLMEKPKAHCTFPAFQEMDHFDFWLIRGEATITLDHKHLYFFYNLL